MLWSDYGMAIVILESKTDVLEQDPQNSGPTSSVLWTGGRDNEEHEATQEMLNCASQDSAVPTQERV